MNNLILHYSLREIDRYYITPQKKKKKKKEKRRRSQADSLFFSQSFQGPGKPMPTPTMPIRNRPTPLNNAQLQPTT
jgi:hypothetical protein